ncbi:MAG: helix-turn-helix transcriptional regulator [Kibdelosporangium sp.]
MAVNKTKAAEELGATLRSLRTEAGLNTRKMAAKAGVSAANISHWETGNRLIPLERLTTLLDEMQVNSEERDRLVGLRKQAEGPGELAAGGPSVEPLLAQLIEYEQTACKITTFELSTIPGLLQTTDYARAIIGDGPDAGVRVALRAGRRDVITRENAPVELVALIDSEVLVRPIAPREVMISQLRHLLDMAARPNITILLVPSTYPGWHPGLQGSFVVLEFPLAAPVVLVEAYRASAFLWDEQTVETYIASTETIQSRAMTKEDTLKAIEEMLAGMESQ